MNNAKKPRIPTFSERFAMSVNNAGGINNAADLLGIKRQTISLWYNGSRVPDAMSLFRISTGFGVSVDYLLGLTDIPTPDTSEQGIFNVTGLRSESISKLNQFFEKRNVRDYTDLINAIITNNNFEYFLAVLDGFLDDDDINVSIGMASAKIPSQRVALFEASDTLRRIMEHVKTTFKENGYLTTSQRLDKWYESEREKLGEAISDQYQVE